MPGGFPIGPELCNAQSFNANIGAFSNGYTTVPTPSATANTKGSWSSIGTTTYDCVAATVQMYLNETGGATTLSYAFDIGIGGGGSQVVLVNNLLLSVAAQYNQFGAVYHIPLSIPGGTQFWMRSQCNVASGTAQGGASFILWDGAQTNVEGAAGVDSIGFSTATTLGAAVAAGNGSKGSYAQLTAATTRDYSALAVYVDPQITNGGGGFYVDIAIGGSGSEVVIIPNLFIWLSPINNSQFFQIYVPSGTRIAARASSLNNATFTVGVTVYGVYL